jgi:hypothetical protein
MDAFHSTVARFIEAKDGKPLYGEFWPWLRAQAQHALYDGFFAAWRSLPQPEVAFFDVLSIELEKWQENHK